MRTVQLIWVSEKAKYFFAGARAGFCAREEILPRRANQLVMRMLCRSARSSFLACARRGPVVNALNPRNHITSRGSILNSRWKEAVELKCTIKFKAWTKDRRSTSGCRQTRYRSGCVKVEASRRAHPTGLWLRKAHDAESCAAKLVTASGSLARGHARHSTPWRLGRPCVGSRVEHQAGRLLDDLDIADHGAAKAVGGVEVVIGRL